MPKVTNVYLTALPNGVTPEGKRLRLSVLLSPKDEAGPDDPLSPFVNWPHWIGSNSWNASWKVTINGTDLIPTVIQSPETHGADLWNYIFDGYLSPPLRQPRDLTKIKNSWVIAHRAHLVQSHIDDYRTIHSRLAIARQSGRIDPVMINVLLAERTVNRNAMRLYIHPRVGAAGPGDKNLEQEVLAATKATSFFNGTGPGTLFNGEQQDLQLEVARRINYGLNRLVATPGRRLRGVALLALYRTCATAAQASLTVGNIQTEIANPIYDPNTGQTAKDFLDSMQPFVEFRLFHQRSKKETYAMHPQPPGPPPDTNDFQTMLARVNQFPALLRPLGLVVDMEVEPPAAAFTTISVTNSFTNPPFAVVPMTTNCTVVRATDQSLQDFYPTSNGINQLLRTAGSSRYLFLQATDASNLPVFQFVTEDTDGSAQKATEQEDAQSRAAEYQSKASADTSGSDTASGRSVGVTLLYTQRAERTQQALNRTSDIASSPDSTPLFAEDLILGFRVDVRRDDASSPQERAMWRPLSNRTGRYRVLNASGAGLEYTPRSDIEKAVDEGFISPMASTPVPPASQTTFAANDPTAPPDPIVQVHESLFTWAGWSLSVRPIFKSSASSQGPNQEPSKRIIPKYTLDEHSLPPLRFDKSYTFRCRVVDLAGNSVSVTSAETSADILSTYVPQRLEPIRPPHVLLTRPLRRTSAPGEQANVLVIRDGRGVSSRILAAPREAIRIAEMHDRLNSPDLPTDAFYRAILMENGSFPSVATANDIGLLNDVTLEGKPNMWNDAIFLPRKDRQRPDCPYLPDPWANWILIIPSLVREPGSAEPDPFQSIYVGLYKDADPQYSPIGDSTWPDCGPIRLNLAASQGTSASVSKDPELSNDDASESPLVRALSILVPKARTVTVQISTARDNPHVPDPTWAGSKARLMTLLEKATEAAASTVLDGTHAPETPPIQLTLVHAVRQPLVPPSFSAGFDIQRDYGETAASVQDDSSISGDWWSTAKISCHANWTDTVDDVNQKGPGPLPNAEVAFQLLAIGGDGDTTTSREANRQVHRFRDTRAHDVTYTLQAASAFRSFYAEDDEGPFVTDGSAPLSITVKSSVRPPAPSIAYIVPAFLWEEGYNPARKEIARGRITALRIYLLRPFLVSGDREQIGFVIPPAGANDVVLGLSSRRGLDPIWAGGKKAGASDLTAADFAGGDNVAQGCMLAETPVTVDVVPYKVQFCGERNMWYCDIRIDSKDAYTPFVRLGVVRYQPDAVMKDTNDARISPVVVTDFMQLAPNRWLHLHKKDSKNYSLTISGVTYQGAEAGPDASTYPACSVSPAGQPIVKHSTFNITVQQRWHAVGKDLGWRPAACAPIPNCTLSEDSGITVWRYDLKLDHSSSTHKYRLLIKEYEWFPVEKQDMSGPEAVPQSRLIYADFIEL